ncbi:DUF887-domain-containing protein [Dioszegia hungarica]|uniref:DUF887-domain-containing protein n=1 Tax=Dioszegia hungarica TaxID=4972 RepID=A0AA38LWA0_9TREE|nr:DUF887-domain-containing protein [Dioszegia hungarica]KAI9636404.1 DUF887-domain-containing protein [Dioszegia hungarica]
MPNLTSLDALTVNTPLPLLGPHLPAFVLSVAACYAIQYATYAFGPSLVGAGKWAQLDRRTRTESLTRTVSTVHAVIAIPCAIYALSSKTLQADPVFGYDRDVGHILAISAGYFLWDTIDSCLNSSAGFVLHGAACLVVYLCAFRPFLAGYGAPFLLWELSTPILNLYWFMDKLGTGRLHPEVINITGAIFAFTFFGARICYGGYTSLSVFRDLWLERDQLNSFLTLNICAGCLALNGLNWMWFIKICRKFLGVRSRSTKAEGKKP